MGIHAYALAATVLLAVANEVVESVETVRVVSSATCRYEYQPPVNSNCQRNRCNVQKNAFTGQDSNPPIGQRDLCVVRAPKTAAAPQVVVPIDHLAYGSANCSHQTLMDRGYQFNKILWDGSYVNVIPDHVYPEIAVTVGNASEFWCDAGQLGTFVDLYAGHCAIVITFRWNGRSQSHFTGFWQAVLPADSVSPESVTQQFLLQETDPPCDKCFRSGTCTSVSSAHIQTDGNGIAAHSVAAIDGEEECFILDDTLATDRTGSWVFKSGSSPVPSLALQYTNRYEDAYGVGYDTAVTLMPGISVHGDGHQCVIIAKMSRAHVGIYMYHTDDVIGANTSKPTAPITAVSVQRKRKIPAAWKIGLVSMFNFLLLLLAIAVLCCLGRAYRRRRNEDARRYNEIRLMANNLQDSLGVVDAHGRFLEPRPSQRQSGRQAPARRARGTVNETTPLVQ